MGGLSVLQPTRELLPNARIVYAADSAGFPYGKRSEAEIASRVPADKRGPLEAANIPGGGGPDAHWAMSAALCR